MRSSRSAIANASDESFPTNVNNIPTLMIVCLQARGKNSVQIDNHAISSKNKKRLNKPVDLVYVVD
jgi:hypothetical protein